MSGVEAVGLLLGALPVLIEAIKAYRSASDKIHTFRHYSREVDRIQRRFQTQKQFFLNECHQLLRLILDNDQKAKEMMENSTQQLWHDKELDEQLNNCLGDNYHACCNILEDTGAALKEFEQELKCFDILTASRDKEERLKDTIRRIRKSVKIAFEKTRFEKIIVNLRDSNADLCQLRSYLGDFQQQRLCASKLCVARRSLPRQYTEIQETSQKLHETLIREWCCGDTTHTAHTAKLFLDAQVDDDVRLDMALSFYRRNVQKNPSQPSESLTAEKPIWICVQSKNIDASYPDRGGGNPPTTSPGIRAVAKMIQEQRSELVAVEPAIPKRISSEASESCMDRGKKRKKVHFQGDNVGCPEVGKEQQEQDVASACVQLPSLQNTKLCQTLSARRPANCRICHLETPNLFKHVFYTAERKRCNRSDLATKTISLSDLVRNITEETVDPLQSLKLAHKLATAVLQYHSTPWLNQEWRLQDISFFGAQIESSEDVLSTLHFSSQISERDADPATNQVSERDADPALLPMDGIEGTVSTSAGSDVDDPKILYGINNVTLFSLGDALLELSHWRFLESDVILNARRLAARRAPLGPKYRDIVQKCLQCNFGFGTDLRRSELQNAVYSDVVCQLEKMIDALDINDD